MANKVSEAEFGPERGEAFDKERPVKFDATPRLEYDFDYIFKQRRKCFDFRLEKNDILLVWLSSYTVLFVVFMLIHVSVAWIVIGIVSSLLYYYQRSFFNGAHIRNSAFNAKLLDSILKLWLAAASLAAIAYFVRIIAAPLNYDDLADFFGSFSVVAITTIQRFWYRQYSPQTEGTVCLDIETLREGRTYIRQPLGCYEVLCVIILAILVCFVLIDAFGIILSFLSYPLSEIVITSYGKIHYTCLGMVNGSSIIILEAGYLTPDVSLYWYQLGLSESTRVCLYDRSGTGWSQRQSNVDFEAEAFNMHSVLVQEFDRAGVELSEAVAVVRGHSRGFQSAARFKFDYDSLYKRVLIISINGTVCSRDMLFKDGPTPNSMIYVIAPFINMFGGALRLIYPLIEETTINGRNLNDVSPECPYEVYKADIPIQGKYLEVMIKPGFWRTAGQRNLAWDLPGTLMEENCFGNILNTSDFFEPCRGMIAADECSVPSPVAPMTISCPYTHTSIVLRKSFADLAIEDIRLFLSMELGI